MDNNTLNGFEVFEEFMPGSVVNNNTSINDSDIIDGASEELTEEELEALTKKGKGSSNDDKDAKQDKKEDKDNKQDPDDDSSKDDKDNKNDKVDDDTVIDTDNQADDDTEDNAVATFFEALSDKMGWELDEDEEIPQTPEELVEYFQEVIEENSVPQYASEEVEALDKFVKNGGNLKDYFQIDGELDLEDFEIEDNEVNQKLVIKEFLKEKGFSSKQIDKKLTKYEDAGLLEDEATDALEALRDIREQKKQQLLEEQEKSANELKKRQQEYFNSVVTEIKGMDNIRGIKIPQKINRHYQNIYSNPQLMERLSIRKTIPKA